MRRALTVLVATATLATAACSDNAEKPTAAAGPTGGVLRVGITEPGSVDPGNAYEPNGTLISELVCEPLLSLDPETGEVRQGLVTQWVISNGGRRITVRMRKARYSNGERVTADDVVAAISRAASEEYAGNVATLFEPVVGFDEISGRIEPRHERFRQRLRGLTVIDGQSFSIDLSRRDADFLRVLAHPATAPVHKPDPVGAQPVCAGPYKLERPWAPGQTPVRLVRNEHYHGGHPAFTGGGRGYPDAIDFHVSTDPMAAWQQGAVDVAATTFERAKALSPEDRHERPSGHIDYVGLPQQEGSPFADPAVRRGLSAALDRTRLLEGRPPANGFMPGQSCDAAPSTPAADPPPRLADAQVKLYYDESFANASLAAAVAAQWRERTGLTVVPTAIPFDELASKASGPQGVDGAFLMGWRPTAPRPDSYLAPLFTSAGIGRDNLTRFVDPEFDRTLDREARGATDVEDADLGYRTAHQRLCEAMPMIPLTTGMSRYAIRSTRVATASRTKSTLDATRGWPVLRELYLREGAG